MANAFPPLPLRFPLVNDDGTMSNVWAAWFRELLFRVGSTDTAIASPASPGATYSQAEAVAIRNALVSIKTVLENRKFIES